MTRTIPGTRVDELREEVAAAAAHADAIRDALAREEADAEKLEPRRRAATSADASARAAYEELRDKLPERLSATRDAIEELMDARGRLSETRRAVDRLGANPTCVTPRPLHRTPEGAKALEAIRSSLRSAI